MSDNIIPIWQGYKNYDHYWWVNPRNLRLWFNETVSIGYPTVGTKDCYYNIPASFDIETSSFYHFGEKCATMYLWSLCINGSTLLGRTWEDFRDVIDFLEEHLHTRKVHLIIYVHNLGYEFQFMRKWFNWTRVFAVKERRPIHAVMENGIEFKCSYILSNYALAYIGAKLLLRYPVQKAVGDLDYSLVRHYLTPITEKEIWYSVKDVQVVTSYIQEKIEQEGGINNIPLTNTGYVRRYCRDFCFTQFQKDKKLSKKLAARYHERMKTLQIASACEYDQLHWGFAGGFTHAAPAHSGHPLRNVGSADLASSYPAVMVMKKFPMSRGTFLGNSNYEEVESLISLGYCVLFTVRLIDVVPKFIYENYISASRCTDLSKDAVINNGRVKSLDLINDDRIEESIKELGFGKTEHITKEKISENLETEEIAKEILCFRKVFSTNSIAKFLANHNAEDGTVLISEIQTKARGRSGKKWEAPDGGIWMSLILRPQVPPARIGLITLATGVAIAKSIRSLGLDAKIKWPNDVLIHGDKISGVLTEVNATFNEIDWIVVGIGIDSNISLEDFSEDIRPGTTTLTEELPAEIDENELIAIFLNEFEEVYKLYKDGEVEAILKDWRELSDTIGKYVNITQTGGKITQGYVVGINNEGSLIIERQDGALEKIISGELRTVN